MVKKKDLFMFHYLIRKDILQDGHSPDNKAMDRNRKLYCDSCPTSFYIRFIIYFGCMLKYMMLLPFKQGLGAGFLPSIPKTIRIGIGDGITYRGCRAAWFRT